MASVHDLQFSNDPLPHLLLGLDVYDLGQLVLSKRALGVSSRTLRAITVPVVKCLTLLTVPPLPEPSSLRISRSSGRRSSLYSMPISSWPSLPSSRALSTSARLVSAVGGGRGAAGVRARPLTFLRFMERGANGSAMVPGIYGVTSVFAVDVGGFRASKMRWWRRGVRGGVLVDLGQREPSSHSFLLEATAAQTVEGGLEPRDEERPAR